MVKQEENKERICILIDAANFYYLVLKKMNLHDLDFSFEKFTEFLANKREIIKEGKRFYSGTVREKEGDLKSKKAMAKQTTLFTELRLDNWQIKTSKLRTRVETIIIDDRVIDYQNILKKDIKEIQFERNREKGIDVKIATDLIVGAFDDKYDTAILVSSDSDLIPAMDWVRKRTNKKIEYVGFSILDPGSNRKDDTKPSPSMITNSDIARTLVASDLEPFTKSFIQKNLFEEELKKER